VITVAALRFLYTVTLQKPWSVQAVIPAPKLPRTLPVVLSPAEVVRFLESVTIPKQRAILTTCYAAGLRVSEAVHLTIPAIDSQRMVLRVEQGKGRKDRSVMLSPTLLGILRAWWRLSRPGTGSFPAIAPGALSRPTPWIGPVSTRIGAAALLSRSRHMRCVMRSPSIFSKRAPTSARFRCCSAIGVSRRRRGIWRSPRRRCAPPRVRSTCSRARHGDTYRTQVGPALPLAHRRVMTAITVCRTAALGGHVEQCDDCRHRRIWYNSCRNRHCPACQSLARATWIEARTADLLDTEYFHVVFTMPQPVAEIAVQNKAVVYGILFRATAETLRIIAADPKHLGAELGFFAVLHTWGQTLGHHPHLHCVVPGGGLSPDRSRWIPCRPGFFLPVRVLSRLFRRRFLTALQKAFDAGELRFAGAPLAPLLLE